MDLELTSYGRNSQNIETAANGQSNGVASGNWKLIVLRKYTLAICFLETLAIVLLTSYLFLPKPPATPDVSPSGCQHYQFYSNNVSSQRLLVGPTATSCNQRQHDLNFTVTCRSVNTGSCEMWDRNLDEDKPEISLEDLRRRNKDEFIAVRTAKRGDRFISYLISNVLKSGDLSLETHLLVSLDKRRQKIIGWGGALTDSSINNILSLTTNGSIRLLDDYFGPNGLKFNMVRLTIGGSDFSSRFYTNDDLDETAGEPTDFDLDKFKLAEDDLLYKIPMIENLKQRYFSANHRELKLLGSMWSPPTWMKTNHHFNKGQLKGSFEQDERYFAALANLKRKFLLAYANHSINFWGLTVMNEPIFAVQPFLNFNTMIFPQQDYAKYIAKYLGPVLRNTEQLRHVKLIAHDDNRRFLFDYTEPILRMERVRDYIDGVATHGYIDEDYHLMKELYASQRSGGRDFFILPTELCSGHLPYMEKALVGNWHRGVHYALDIIRSLQNSAAGWVDWNMALDINGGPGWLGGRLDSPVIVDKSKDLYHKSPMYYALGQFSRHIPPGSVLVESRLVNGIYDYALEQVTFELPDGETLATVVLNNNPYGVYICFGRDEQMEMGKKAQFWRMHFHADSITTVLYKKSLLVQ